MNIYLILTCIKRARYNYLPLEFIRRNRSTSAHFAEGIIGKREHDEYTVRVANNVGEATALMEAGFDYATGKYSDGGKIFKKLKTDDYLECGSSP